MSRAAAIRLALLAALGTSVAVLVRALRGDPAPVFSAPTSHHGVLAPRPAPLTPAPATRPAPQGTTDGTAPADTVAAPPEPPPGTVAVDAVDAASSAPAPASTAAASAPAAASATPAGPTSAAKTVPEGKRWAFPVDGECPPTHPIKAKLRSGIYHLPGMMAYDRARPDRCYATEADAEADGLRRAKR